MLQKGYNQKVLPPVIFVITMFCPLQCFQYPVISYICSGALIWVVEPVCTDIEPLEG